MPRYEVRLVRDAFGGQAKDVIEADRFTIPDIGAALIFEEAPDRTYPNATIVVAAYAPGLWERVVRLDEEPKP